MIMDESKAELESLIMHAGEIVGDFGVAEDIQLGRSYFGQSETVSRTVDGTNDGGGRDQDIYIYLYR